MKKILRSCCFFLVITAAMLCLAGCSLFGDDDEGAATTTDRYGFERPADCWLTDCLLLSSLDNVDDLIGTGGDSGLLSDYALQNDGVGLHMGASTNDPYGGDENYLVFLLYGTPGHTVNLKTYLKFTLVNGTSVLYDEECVSISTNSIGTYGLWLEEGPDLEKPADERLVVSLEYTEDEAAVQGYLVIPFELKGEGTLYADLRVENTPQSGSVNYYIDGYSSAEVRSADSSAQSANTTQVNIQSCTVRYLSEANYNMGDFSDSLLTSSPSFDNGAISYMVLDFDFSALADNDGGHSINVLARVPEATVMEATIQDAPTGKIEEVSENDVTTIYASYSVPPVADQYKKVRMIVQLTPLDEGIANVDIFLVGAARADSTSITKTVGYNYINTALVSGVPELRYTLNKDGKSYTATDLWRSDLTEINVPDEYKGLPVTGVSGSLFKGNTKITALSIGKNVSSLASNAFEGCKALQSVTISSYSTTLGNALFKNCTALKSVTLPEETTSIPLNFFYGCSSLTTLNGIGNVTVIGISAFEGCSSLTQLTCGELTSVGTSAFKGCSSLRSVSTLRLTEMPKSIFENCASLQWFDLTGVTKINESAFRNCKAFTQIVIPDSCLLITSSSCFEGTSGVRSLSLGKNVYLDGMTGKFFDRTSLESITVDAENPSYASAGNCVVNKNGGNIVYIGCKSSVIPEGVTVIDQYAFEGCTGLTSITIPDGVTEISRGAFQGCSALKQITIPSSVTEVWQYAFRDCDALTSVSGMKGTWYVAVGPKKDYSGEDKSLSSSNAAAYLTDTYCDKYFLRGGR